jgi:putative membrane protein
MNDRGAVSTRGVANCCEPDDFISSIRNGDKMFSRRTIWASIATTTAYPSFVWPQPAAAGPNSIEADHIQQTMAIGSLTLLVSRMATEKISVPKLKEFALLEAAEQDTLLDVLKSLQSPSQVKGVVVPLPDADLEAQLVPLGLQIFKKMRSMEAGTDFSREFFLVQSEAHQQLLRIQEDYLKLGREPVSINVAKLADGLIREHLQLLSDIKFEMGAAGQAAGAAR